MTHKKDRPFTDTEIGILKGDDECLPEHLLDERVEGLEAIKNIINPRMSMQTFYLRHRAALDYILFIDKDHWRRKTPKFFTFRRLIYHYMLKRKVM